LLSAKRPDWCPAPRAPRVAPKARSRRTKHLSRGWMSHGDLVTPSRAYFSLPGDETRSGAQDLRRGLRHSARSNRTWSAPEDRGLSGTLASNGGEHRRLRRSAGTPALLRVQAGQDGWAACGAGPQIEADSRRPGGVECVLCVVRGRSQLSSVAVEIRF